MKYIKRFSVIFFAIVLLFSLVPFQAFAVDPVSASVIANAFAQAVASYGAANGVAMTFDVSSTDGIGESVHELWKRFREGQQTADDYATIAQAIFPELYYKTATAIGTASDAVAVGVHISSEYAEELDDFYNWLLSGPAEMVQVDNQYYQFSQAQIGPSSSPIPVASIQNTLFVGQPLGVYSTTNNQTNYSVTTRAFFNDGKYYHTFGVNSPVEAYCFAYPYPNSSGDHFYYVVCSYSSTYWNGFSYNTSNGNYGVMRSYSNQPTLSSTDSSTGLRYSQSDYQWVSENYVPVFSSLRDGLDAVKGDVDSPVYDELGIEAYYNSGIADIPDTADPNYDALNRAKDIPLNIPWDDAIYGDGTGTLTDAQSAAIAGDLTQALETGRTVELVEEQDIPIQPDYSDVLLPLIPINVPSFNFSLSGIWYYVRSWVTSLGAWLSMMFSVWGILPYAIVVPVYACLVIVIVLGLYKRFFM